MQQMITGASSIRQASHQKPIREVTGTSNKGFLQPSTTSRSWQLDETGISKLSSNKTHPCNTKTFIEIIRHNNCVFLLLR